MKKFFLAAIAAILFTGCQAADPYVIKTTNGSVRGFDEEGTMAFKGIPYAKAGRCMPPQPVEKWDSVLDCTQWGPQSLQSGRIQPGSSEDCCVLNVWTTDTKGRKRSCSGATAADSIPEHRPGIRVWAWPRRM